MYFRLTHFVTLGKHFSTKKKPKASSHLDLETTPQPRSRRPLVRFEDIVVVVVSGRHVVANRIAAAKVPHIS
jgi:hypothetical protein